MLPSFDSLSENEKDVLCMLCKWDIDSFKIVYPEASNYLIIDAFHRPPKLNGLYTVRSIYFGDIYSLLVWGFMVIKKVNNQDIFTIKEDAHIVVKHERLRAAKELLSNQNHKLALQFYHRHVLNMDDFRNVKVSDLQLMAETGAKVAKNLVNSLET